jgi:hypothetical protein
MTEPRFPVLDALGAELDRAIARDSARRVPRIRALRPITLAVILTLLAAGAAAAASYILTGSPIPGARAQDVPPEATPLSETARLMGLDAPDPVGGLPWDMRVSRSRTGTLCTAVGQVAGGKLGIVGLDGRFRALAQLGNDTCGEDPGGVPALLGARVFDAPRRDDVRTVVNGVAGSGVTAVVIEGPGEPRELELGPGGSFLTVYAGYPEDVSPVVRFSRRGAADRTIALAAVDRPQAPDPEGGAPWAVSAEWRAGGARAGQTCAQVRRERSREPAFGGVSYPVCGDLRRDPFFFELAPLPRAVEVRDPLQTFPWGLGAPRTMLWGAARPDVERIAVVGPAGRTELDLSAPSPGFVAAFPAGTRPADLTVEVTLAGGEVRRLVGPQNLRDADGRRIAPQLREPVPIPKSLRPRPAAPGSEPPWLTPDRESVRIARRLADPAGGADWAVRTFDARGRGDGRRLRCAQLGRLEGRELVRPVGGGRIALDDPAAACIAPGDNRRREPVSRIETFVDDPRSYAPRPLATIVWGTAGPSARRVQVAGPAGERPLPLGAGGAFVAIYPPHLTARDLVVRTTYDDGHRHSVERFRSERWAVEPGSERIEARAPDPDGGPPYGLLVWRTARGALCREEGRVLGDTVGTFDTRTSIFHPYPVDEGGSCGATPERLTRSQPLAFSVGSAPGEADTESARIRRTLPGRTMISGSAHPDVREVTIHTPRDVRTLRPAGRGRSFLAVYDGEFFSGTITLTALFADGTTTRRRMPVGGP